MSTLVSPFRVQQSRWLSIALFFFFFVGLLHAQQSDEMQAPPPQQQQQSQQPQEQVQPDSGPLSADEIIQILQDNPDLLSEAKAEIVSKAQERGYTITEAEITDDRLFSQIRDDDRVRLVLSDELKKRGFGAQPQEQQSTRPTGASGQRQPGPGQNTNRNLPQTGAPQGEKMPSTADTQGRNRETDKSKAPKNDPYRNLPVLKELYTQTQSIADPEKLERFGAALFRNSSATTDKAALDVPVGSDYVLGPGDQLVIEYWGSASQRLQVNVDREGRIVLPEAGSILVAGRTLGDAQKMIQSTLSRQFKNIAVDVTLGRLRSVRVYVVGDVKKPGAYDISALSTALSALLAAEGPTDTGSLRIVKHFRGQKLVEQIDLYELMLKGVTSAVGRIESGDSILVPPVGAQVTVAGMVRRPAIYELYREETLDQALELAGGVLVTGETSKIKVERIQAHERKVMLDVNLPQSGDIRVMDDTFKKLPIKDGDRITIAPILPYTDRTVYLQGHVYRPGKYPFKDGIRVADLIGSFHDLLPEPADRAEIVRLTPPDYRPNVISFNIRDVLEKQEPGPTLQPFDTVRIFGRYEADAPKVSIYGEVLRPGEYPLSENMTAASLLRMSGGFKRSAYVASADLSSYAIVNGERVELEHREVPIGRAAAGELDTDVLLKPGDSLTIRQLGGWNNIGGAITITGEVLHPGRYGIQQGERLSSVLKRAGGFLPEAYPYGSVLERAQVKELSSKNRDELISKLQSQAFAGDGTGRPEPVSVTRQRQQLIDKLKQIQPNGRLLIHISPDIAKWENTITDIEVRPADSLIIPKRPNFVLVAGQVYSPTAISFAPGRHASWYLRQAGGPTGFASRKDIFVVRANGAVVGRSSGQWWTGNALNTVLLPGDTVYVPEKISSGDKFKQFAEVSQILSGLAVAARVAISF
jgi:protein involved in polysaccharide export with SLBB domain